MKKIVALAVLIGGSWLSAEPEDHRLPNRSGGTKPRYQAEELSSSSTFQGFIKCGSAPESKTDTRFLYVIVAKTREGQFRKASPESNGAYCAAMAVKGNEIRGVVEPMIEAAPAEMRSEYVTVVPGEVIGKEPGLMYMMMPDADPSKPPHWPIAACDKQVAAAEELALIYQEGDRGVSGTETVTPPPVKEPATDSGDSSP